MTETSVGEQVRVTLVGGPADWDGRVLTYPAEVLSDDPGAFLISEHPPARGDDEDPDPRAVYEPEPGGDPAVWWFRGWFPAAASDPDPEP